MVKRRPGAEREDHRRRRRSRRRPPGQHRLGQRAASDGPTARLRLPPGTTAAQARPVQGRQFRSRSAGRIPCRGGRPAPGPAGRPPGRQVGEQPASCPRWRAPRALLMRNMKVSCDSRPSANSCRSALTARSRSASEARRYPGDAGVSGADPPMNGVSASSAPGARESRGSAARSARSGLRPVVMAGVDTSGRRASAAGSGRRPCGPGRTSAAAGSSAAQSSCANGHRVRNRQPDGGLIGLGSSPRMPTPFLARSTVGSGTGMVAIRPAVYGCAARW